MSRPLKTRLLHWRSGFLLSFGLQVVSWNLSHLLVLLLASRNTIKKIPTVGRFIGGATCGKSIAMVRPYQKLATRTCCPPKSRPVESRENSQKGKNAQNSKKLHKLTSWATNSLTSTVSHFKLIGNRPTPVITPIKNHTPKCIECNFA